MTDQNKWALSKPESIKLFSICDIPYNTARNFSPNYAVCQLTNSPACKFQATPNRPEIKPNLSTRNLHYVPDGFH